MNHLQDALQQRARPAFTILCILLLTLGLTVGTLYMLGTIEPIPPTPLIAPGGGYAT